MCIFACKRCEWYSPEEVPIDRGCKLSAIFQHISTCSHFAAGTIQDLVFDHPRKRSSSFDQVGFYGHKVQYRWDIQKRFMGVVSALLAPADAVLASMPPAIVDALQTRQDVDFRKSRGVFKNRRPRTSTIKVEFVLDPVHFCCSAVEARAKAPNSMANLLLRNVGWHEHWPN